MRKLYLSDTDRKIAGVCGGLGEYFDMDPTIIRLAFIFLALVTVVVPVVIGYIIAAVIIPRAPSHL